MINIDLNKYEKSFINIINKDNLNKITFFLLSNDCDYIEELLEDYLDIFTFEYDEFVIRFNKLNDKYNHNLINKIRDDRNIIDEFYFDKI